MGCCRNVTLVYTNEYMVKLIAEPAEIVKGGLTVIWSSKTSRE